MEKILRRYERAAERILENEGLTDGLDDEAAAVLINWSLSWTASIVSATLGMREEEADEVTSPRLKANRRLMRYVKLWTAQRSEGQQDDLSGPDASLTSNIEIENRPPAVAERAQQIVEQATIASGYGPLTDPSSNVSNETIANSLVAITAIVGQPAEMISRLRTLLEQTFSVKPERTERP